MSVVQLPRYASFASLRKRAVNDHENNNIDASKLSVIRITTEQIYQLLLDASDSLSGEILQQTCTVVLHRCQDAIVKPSLENNRTGNTKSPPPAERPQRETNDSLQAAIDERMASVVQNDSIRPRKSAGGSGKHTSKLNATLPNDDDDGQYDVFLNICDSFLITNHQQTRRNYLNFKRSDSNIPLMIIVHLCGAFFMFTGYVWSYDMKIYHQYPAATLSIIFGFLTSFLLSWITFNRIVFLSFQYNIVRLQRYHEFVVHFYNSPYGQWLDNGVVLLIALSTGFYLMNIALMDLCDPNMVVTVGKNHHHECVSFNEPPPESFMFTMVSIVVFQIVARGVSCIALVCSWVICIVSINVTLFLSDSGSYVWINLLQFLFLWLSYELERQPLCQYLKTLKVIEAGEITAKLQLRLATYQSLLASDALEAKCSMVRHIGHEIRTPLNVVGVGVDMLLLELASESSTLPNGIMEIIEGIKEASTASLSVINELLEFEKLAAGKTTLECAITSVLPFLEQVMRQHAIPVRAKNIQFDFVPSITRNATMNVDPLKLATVFRNLFSNAIKFTEKNGRVTVCTELKDEIVQISVKDSGVGLSAENLTRLFGEGVQFNANGLQGGGGSGLGLFISKGFVELHKNGKIWAESEGEGFGCTFFVHVPLHSLHYVDTSQTRIASSTGRIPTNQVEIVFNASTTTATIPRRSIARVVNHSSTEVPEGKHSESMPLQNPGVDTWKPLVLVVDDSAMNRKMLVRMLTAKGFACCEAEDGMAGLCEVSRMKSLQSNVSGLGGANIGPGSKNGDASPALHVPFRGGTPVHSPPRVAGSSLAASRQHSKSIAESLDFVPNFAIDAVLIDSNMPRMNGPEAIVEMRKIGFRGPIIGVSGGDKKTLKEFVDAGADDTMQKPVQSDELVNMLLTELELVVHRETSRPTVSEGNDDGNMSASKIARQDYITRLRNFLAVCQRVVVK